jgi:hypothetical protein
MLPNPWPLNSRANQQPVKKREEGKGFGGGFKKKGVGSGLRGALQPPPEVGVGQSPFPKQKQSFWFGSCSLNFV